MGKAGPPAGIVKKNSAAIILTWCRACGQSAEGLAHGFGLTEPRMMIIYPFVALARVACAEQQKPNPYRPMVRAPFGWNQNRIED